MNLTSYYQKIHEFESSIVEPFVVLVSQATDDGGKEGLLTEVPKAVAARMLAEGRGRLASEQVARDFQDKKAEAKRAADTEATANRMQVTLVPTADLMKTKRYPKE
jgi:tRNA 2-selenouridine synthase SelU